MDLVCLAFALYKAQNLCKPKLAVTEIKMLSFNIIMFCNFSGSANKPRQSRN